MAALSIGPGSTVVDLAAGTGKLTRTLVPTGARVIPVEPSAAMRAQLKAALPGLLGVLDGVAEDIPLGDGTVDAVVVGQGFHWFDGDRALAEIHRVLRPGGGLGMAWNARDRSVDWVDRLVEMTEPYRGDVPTYRDGRWRDAFDRTTLFTPLEHRRFDSDHEVDRATMLERMASISWIASLPDGERAALLGRLARLFAEVPDPFVVPNHTDVWWCHRLS